MPKSVLSFAVAVALHAGLVLPALAEDPAAIVADLYASHPWTQDPPGGAAIWYPHLAEAWTTGNAASGRDFLAGGGAVTTEILLDTGHEARILAVTSGAGGEARALNYGMVLDDAAGWQIIEVFTEPETGEGTYLSDLLAGAAGG